MYGIFRIRWSREPNLVPFYLYDWIFECPENIQNKRFPDVRWSSSKLAILKLTCHNADWW